MNARLYRNGWLLVFTVLVLGCLSQARALAEAGEGVFTSPNDPDGLQGVYVKYKSDGYDTTPGSGYTDAQCQITPLYDPVRKINSPQMTAGGGVWKLYNESPPVVMAAGGYGYCGYRTGSMRFSASPAPGWPGNGGVTAGYYQFKFIVNNQTNHTFIIQAWLTDGSWSLVSPPAVPDGNPVSGPGGGASGTDKGAMTVTAQYKKSGVVYPLPAKVALLGPQVYSATLPATGTGTINPLTTGLYKVTFSGSHTNASNTVVSDVAERQVLVEKALTSIVTVTFGENGELVSTIGGDNNQGSGGWLVDALKYCFVPDQATVDDAKGALNALTDWGPLAAIKQLAGLGNVQASTEMQLSFPVPGYDPGSGNFNANGTSVPIDMTPFKEAPGFSWFRTLLGWSVPLMFVFGLLPKLLPKQTV